MSPRLASHHGRSQTDVAADNIGLATGFGDAFGRVHPTAGNVAIEMLRLADEVYGPQETLAHNKELLAYEKPGDPHPNAHVTDEALRRGWHAVSAAELGIMAGDSGKFGTLHYSFTDGFFAAYDTADQKRFGTRADDISEANAIVLTGELDGKRTLAISFRGTDQIADFDDYASFAAHFAKFKPFIEALKPFIADADIEQVLVSGHSLGAGLAPTFLSKFPDVPGHTHFRAFTDGSAGSDFGGQDARLENFIHTDDPIPWIPTLGFFGKAGIAALSPIVAAYLGQPGLVLDVAHLLVELEDKVRAGSDIAIDSGVHDPISITHPGSPSALFDEHTHLLYTRDLIKLVEFAEDARSPFSDTTVARKLAAGELYSGKPVLQIGLGEPEIVTWNHVSAGFSPQIRHPLANDDFVLGNNHQDDQFILNSNTLLEKSGSRVFDGGTGSDDVRVPYDETDSHGRPNFKVVEVNGGDVLKYRDVGLIFTTWETVGTFFRTEGIIYDDGKREPLGRVVANSAHIHGDGLDGVAHEAPVHSSDWWI